VCTNTQYTVNEYDAVIEHRNTRRSVSDTAATDVEVTIGNHFPKVENMWTFKLATVKPN